MIEIHFTSNRKPSQKDGSSEGIETPFGLNKKTVDTLNNVKIKTYISQSTSSHCMVKGAVLGIFVFKIIENKACKCIRVHAAPKSFGNILFFIIK